MRGERQRVPYRDAAAIATLRATQPIAACTTFDPGGQRKRTVAAGRVDDRRCRAPIARALARAIGVAAHATGHVDRALVAGRVAGIERCERGAARATVAVAGAIGVNRRVAAPAAPDVDVCLGNGGSVLRDSRPGAGGAAGTASSTAVARSAAIRPQGNGGGLTAGTAERRLEGRRATAAADGLRSRCGTGAGHARGARAAARAARNPHDGARRGQAAVVQRQAGCRARATRTGRAAVLPRGARCTVAALAAGTAVDLEVVEQRTRYRKGRCGTPGRAGGAGRRAVLARRARGTGSGAVRVAHGCRQQQREQLATAQGCGVTMQTRMLH